jgi:hypothetical protein
MRAPHGILIFLSCDMIAETTDGLSNATYRELWSAMDNAKPLSELIDIENSAPNDALGHNTPGMFWDHFSDAAKEELLAIAKKQADEDAEWLAAFRAKYPLTAQDA